jgi:hypothetical protein
MNTVEVLAEGNAKLKEALRGDIQGSTSKFAIFIFQVPVMLLSYSIISFLVGLSVIVLEPLLGSPSSDEIKVQNTLILKSKKSEFQLTTCDRLPPFTCCIC